ncbi:hypothetical protein EIP86_005094 [Pleurotus ostreatoroseus]|nr:hypothetical protein EIP86_005094 [Pleurotus ostreatoroseus]
MRSFGVILILFALNTVIHVNAAPAPAQESMALPGAPLVGTVTVGVSLPTNIPNVNALSGEGGLPVKRAIRTNSRLQPRDPGKPLLKHREFHNADFSASSPNNTIPIPSSNPATTATVERRDKSKHKMPSNKAAPDSKDSAPPSGSNPAQGAASAVKEAGAAPNGLSALYYSASNPLGSVPDTPVTSKDDPPVDAPLASASPVPKYAPENPAPSNSGAYPSSPSGPGYSATPGYQSGSSDFQEPSPSPAPAKRHAVGLSTEPLIPSTDPTQRDPQMGLVNLDSNQKPDPTLPNTPKVPKPDVPAPSGAPIDPNAPVDPNAPNLPASTNAPQSPGTNPDAPANPTFEAPPP